MVTFGELLPISESSILLPQFRFKAPSPRQHFVHRYRAYAAASTDCTTVCFLRTRSEPGVLAPRQQQKGVFRGIRASVVPDFEASTIFAVNSPGEAVNSPGEAVEIQPDTGGFGGTFGGESGGEGGGGSGGGGNNWGNNNSEGQGGSEESGDHNKDNSKKAMSMSQKLTLGYAVLVGAGGLMGYLKSGSQKSLMAGGLSALLLYLVYIQLPTRTVFASSLGLGLSAALLGVMGSRFKNSGKVFPAGVVSVVSLVMTGGYLHGILRSMH
ncbi:hypothetical protein RJ639_039649 [Escallonia herrerae]|uniref:Uncharacterized protein n=1 Tax=Escallonia herrerae TaxID=1293975 RepID=A0AA88WMW2_9ASTE|nr:hypothetical protein RJ639_039649 [Escallonia herrerae]